MKAYVYKMQWLCDAKEAIRLIKVLGARSLTVINARDRSNDLKITARFHSMVQYESKEANKKTIEWIRIQNQLNRDLDFELLRG